MRKVPISVEVFKSCNQRMERKHIFFPKQSHKSKGSSSLYRLMS